MYVAEGLFFTWEAIWGKILTIDQLQRRGFTPANRCYLCHESEECGSPPPALCKDKDFMRAAFLSFWCYVGEPEVSVGYLVELEWFFGR